ncbi:hypothetical protein ACFFMN_12050 [Planobispora siamensis]|uniref:Uncharacterized protein n=1 Tax=Planobispora siamensis TaxID=936338 RepID=A0A8J3SC72_9ACTN|nr:hypothetical protein [Planobispora siamensis]GIH89916.1 hypothetical protein Psi01_05460 [Planobispora siamensis]
MSVDHSSSSSSTVPALTYLQEAQLQLDEVLSGYDPHGATGDDTTAFSAQLRLAAICAQLAQAEALQSIVTTLEETLNEWRSVLRMSGPS